MKAPRTLKTRERVFTLVAGVFVSVACSFSTDGITFTPDAQFFGGAAGKPTGSGGKGSAGAHSAGAHSGGSNNSDAGSDPMGEAGETETGGTAGLGSAGRNQGGSTNVAGTHSGGTAGVLGFAGNPGAGAGGAPPVTTYPCKGALPGDKYLATFDKLIKPTDHWQDEHKTDFGLYGFPDPAMSRPLMKVGDGALTAESYGTSAPTGVGIRISPCIDLTGVTAIGFTITGAYKAFAPKMVMRVFSNQDWPVDGNAKEGMCVPQSKDIPAWCQPPHVDFTLSNVETKQAFKIGDFTGGKPMDRLATDQIKAIEWAFVWLNDSKVFDASFTIDDVLLYY